jgi:DNA-binding MarR family transcriptional regulator
MAAPAKPDIGHTGARGGLDPASTEARIGLAWRELRRGSAQQAMRDRLYGDLLEAAQVDALDVVMSTGGCRMAELADALRVDPSTATRAIDRLVAAGMVARENATGDGRGVQVVATAAGIELYDELSQRRRTMLFAVLAHFDADERAMLAELLERLVDGVDRYSDRSL